MAASQRRQCIALAMIMMLGVAEGRRVAQNIKHARATSEGTNVDENAVDVFSPRKDVTNRIGDTHTALKKIGKGEGWFGVPFCMVSCPLLWVDAVYNQWKMRSAAKSLICQTTGVSAIPGPSLTRLIDIDHPLATTLHKVMRESVWTFLKAVDNSMVQRSILTVLMAPVGALRALTGMSPLGLCFFKAAWKDITDNSDYEINAKTWWNVMLAGCPDTPSEDAVFEDESATASTIDSMIAALSSEGVGEDDDAKWAGLENVDGEDLRTHKQCVDKKNRQGEWQKRELSIEKGIITWASTAECKDGYNGLGLGLVHWGHSKSFAVQFLTDPDKVVDSAASRVQTYELKGPAAPDYDGKGPTASHPYKVHNCMSMQNAARQFEFCASESTNPEMNKFHDMTQMKKVIDKHISLWDHNEVSATANKINHLVSHSQGSSQLQLDDDSHTAAEARMILGQVKEGSALIETGNVHNGTALLQEAYAAAHRNQHLSTIMHGEASQDMSRGLVVSGNPGAGAGGAITMTEIIIILIVCGGGVLCLGILLSIASANLETSAELEAHVDLKGNSTKAISSHASDEKDDDDDGSMQ